MPRGKDLPGDDLHPDRPLRAPTRRKSAGRDAPQSRTAREASQHTSKFALLAVAMVTALVTAVSTAGATIRSSGVPDGNVAKDDAGATSRQSPARQVQPRRSLRDAAQSKPARMERGPALASRSCISGGHWTRGAANGLPYTINTTAIGGLGDYHHCEASYVNWTWVADDERCRMPSGPADWCQALAGRAILFVGDSLSAQQVASLLHLVVSSDLKRRNSARKPMVDVSNDWRATGAVKACGGKVLINYIRNDELSDRSFEGGCTSVLRGVLSQTKLCRTFTSSKLLADYDTLVLNTGAHMHGITRMTETVVNRTRQLASWLGTKSHKLIWRTGVPGHVDCGKYSAPLEPGSLAAYPQRDHRYHWDRIEPNDRIRARIFEETLPGRVRFLDAAALTRERPDQHLLKGRFGGGSEDCLHYCLPGPIDTWNMVLARMLLE